MKNVDCMRINALSA